MGKIKNWFSNIPMTTKYIVALILIITPLVLGGVFTQSKNDDMEYYGVAYNVVLTQRMRVFVISNYAHIMHDGFNEDNPNKYMNAELILIQQVPHFEDQIDALKNGSEELGIPKPLNEEVVEKLNEISLLTDEFVLHANNLIDDKGNDDDLDYLLTHTLELDQKFFELEVILEDIYIENYRQLSSMNFVVIIITVLIVFFALMQIRLVKRIEYQAKYDKLTNLRNRAYLFNYIKTLNPHEYGVLFIDLHHFKNINNNYGNKLGDFILVEFANRLREFFTSKHIYRYGGDEFVILLNSKDNHIAEAKEYLEDIKFHLLEDFIDERDRKHSIQVTMGLAGVDIGIDSLEDKLKLAEELRFDSSNYRLRPMYCCNVEDTNRRVNLSKSIETAISKNQITAYFHPLHWSDGSIKGFESLARWELDTEVISPGVFIPLINLSGLGYQLDLQMIRLVGEAYNQLDQAVTNINPYISINLAVDTITHIASEEIVKLLEDTKIPKDKIILEILEDVVINTKTRKKLLELKTAGYTVALDDFTTGATSFDYLTLDEFALVKIDQGVIKQLNKSPSRFEVLKDLVQMIHTSNKEVLIEGIETKEEVDIVLSLGVDAIQGYYYSKPLPLEEAILYLKNYNKK